VRSTSSQRKRLYHAKRGKCKRAAATRECDRLPQIDPIGLQMFFSIPFFHQIMVMLGLSSVESNFEVEIPGASRMLLCAGLQALRLSWGALLSGASLPNN
jgi:hypothetical protein